MDNYKDLIAQNNIKTLFELLLSDPNFLNEVNTITELSEKFRVLSRDENFYLLEDFEIIQTRLVKNILHILDKKAVSLIKDSFDGFDLYNGKFTRLLNNEFEIEYLPLDTKRYSSILIKSILSNLLKKIKSEIKKRDSIFHPINSTFNKSYSVPDYKRELKALIKLEKYIEDYNNNPFLDKGAIKYNKPTPKSKQLHLLKKKLNYYLLPKVEDYSLISRELGLIGLDNGNVKCQKDQKTNTKE